MKILGIAKRPQIKGRGGEVKVSALFANVNGINSLRRSKDFELFQRHSFTYMCETLMTKGKFEDVLNNNKKILEVVHATKSQSKGRPTKGQLFYYADRFKAATKIKDEHCICLKLKNVYIIGVYLQHKLELDQKMSIICGILDKVYEEDPNPKILFSGDFNVKLEENNGADFRVLSDILENYSMSVISDIENKTCYNNNGRGASTCDYIACSYNFPYLKTNIIRLHAGSDHCALRITFKLPRFCMKADKGNMTIKRKSAKVDLEAVRERLSLLANNLEQDNNLAENLKDILSSKETTRHKWKKGRRSSKWYSPNVKELRRRCLEAWGAIKAFDRNNLQDSKFKLEALETNYMLAKAAYKKGLKWAKKCAEEEEMDKILAENRTLKDMFKFFKKGNGECNTNEEMALRLLKYCKVAYNPEVEVPLEMDARDDPKTTESPAIDEEEINKITETEVKRH